MSGFDNPVQEAPKNGFQSVFENWPLIVYKKELAARFDCSYGKLRRNVLTDDVLKLADISPDDYAKVRGGFSAAQSARIFAALKIQFTISSKLN